MKRFLSILMIILLLLTFISCDDTPEKSNEDEGQNSSQSDDQGGGSQSDDQGGGSPSVDLGQGGGDEDPGEGGGQTDPVPKETYTVTFIMGEEDPVIETYEEGDPLWLHAPDLGSHGLMNYYYNWDAELDAEVTSEMTVSRIENEGHAIIFMNVYEHAIKIICKGELTVEEFPDVPEIEGYTGIWSPYEDIAGFWSETYPVSCWYYSNEKYNSTGMPKSFIASGGVAFTISEYPIHVADTTLTYVKKENYVSAASGLMSVTSAETSSVIEVTQGEMTDVYAAYSFKEQTDYLIENVPDVNFVNAINVLRQETGDDGWSVPQASNLMYVFRALAEQGKDETFYGYLSDGVENVRSINGECFYLDNSSNRRMCYSTLESSGHLSHDYLFGSTFTGYLWPIKPITVE